KAVVRRVKISNHTMTLGAIAKGSGMIAPNMGTMLAFVTTDADLSLPLLRSALREAVDADISLNRMSVDTDTSPSDTVALLASAQAGHRPIRRRNDNYRKFAAALTRVCQDLAHQIMSDGEGVTRVIRVAVSGARSHAQALTVARSVADSPLVKTAVHGADPNWGRLTMAAGKADAQVRPEKLSIRIGNISVYRRGQPVAADARRLKQLMKKPQVTLHFDLGVGSGRCEVLGCDLSRQYVSINADYRT
ncbi:MAG: bifunctional ornithine acetyltransferase/N-acetylglutamate synthase, partial [Phycisphaerae bacterium]|nr:bifunctional ornithine acetyltransferase/N-acetylglutamate synthase [Phycisphaerae bacterium]